MQLESPENFGNLASINEIGKMEICKGKVWIVEKYQEDKIWVISEFYKEFENSVKKLQKLLDESPIKITFKIKYRNDEDDKYNNSPLFTAEFEKNELSFLASEIFNIYGYESGFFKYIYYDGSDIGPISLNNKTIIRTYFYYYSSNLTIWKDFEKEKKIYFKEAKEEILNNIDKIPQLMNNYIEKILKLIS
jgi:hypothetical protein